VDIRRSGLGARLEVRLDAKTKRRIERAARGYGKKVGDYVRGLCLADVGRREAEGRERRLVDRGLKVLGVVGRGQGRRKKGV
jgi:hypothetical protein